MSFVCSICDVREEHSSVHTAVVELHCVRTDDRIDFPAGSVADGDDDRCPADDVDDTLCPADDDDDALCPADDDDTLCPADDGDNDLCQSDNDDDWCLADDDVNYDRRDFLKVYNLFHHLQEGILINLSVALPLIESFSPKQLQTCVIIMSFALVTPARMRETHLLSQLLSKSTRT